MSAYRIAIDSTTKVIDARAKGYRNLIVAVVAISVSLLASAAVMRALAPLAGLTVLLPICGVFFLIDERLVNRWRSGLLNAWVKKDLDLTSFRFAVDAIPKLPKDTLASMLATLPSTSDLIAEQSISSSTREAVAAEIALVHERVAVGIALKLAAVSIASGTIILTVGLRNPKPVWGCAALLLLPFLGKWLGWRRARVWHRRVAAIHSEADFNEVRHREPVDQLGNRIQ